MLNNKQSAFRKSKQDYEEVWRGASNATEYTFIGERRVFMGQRSSLKGNGRHRTVRELRRVFRIWLMETEQGIIKHRGTGTNTHTRSGVVLLGGLSEAHSAPGRKVKLKSS